MLDWYKISIISKTKFVSNIMIFIIIIPIISKIFEKFGNEVSFSINNTIHIINVNLPFSLGLFYFSALFFLIGNIIYKVFVPEIINENKSFNDFLNAGKGKFHLSKYHENDSNSDLDCTNLYTDEFLERDVLKDFFWYFWSRSLNKNFIIRLFISVFYFLGIIIITFLLIQNISYVIKTMQIFPDYDKYFMFVINLGKN